MTSYSFGDISGMPFDHKLDMLFKNKENGFFIELGANDGIEQSNTAFFEFSRGWKGILIEPSVSKFEKCVRNRPNSSCFNCACVSNTFAESTVSGDFNGGLMASIGGVRLNNGHACVSVPAKTLASIIDSIQPPIAKIDLLSLDTEGYELNILQGLDLTRHRPMYMLIEIYTRDYDVIVDFLKRHNYELHSNFSNYNKKAMPFWDGTHNDYLFVDSSV